MGTLAGKVALVTGGSSGIGLASAEELIREGAFVYITGRKKAELDAAANRLGERCVSIQADISKMEDIDRIYKKIAGDGKALDVLFANAGGGSFAPLGSITEEQYDATFTTNVKGTLFTVQKSLPHLNDGSSIILNASIASVKGIPGLSVYSAAKAALRSFARVWMMDLRERRIRVNVISPAPPTHRDFVLQQAPHRRICSDSSRLRPAVYRQAELERPGRLPVLLSFWLAKVQHLSTG